MLAALHGRMTPPAHPHMMLYDALSMERRQRAPRRSGRRTTLTVPASLVEAAESLADELGTTSNDALIRLAEQGAAVRSRRSRMERLAAERRAAVDRSPDVGPGEMLSPEEFRDAVLAERRGLL